MALRLDEIADALLVEWIVTYGDTVITGKQYGALSESHDWCVELRGRPYYYVDVLSTNQYIISRAGRERLKELEHGSPAGV